MCHSVETLQLNVIPYIRNSTNKETVCEDTTRWIQYDMEAARITELGAILVRSNAPDADDQLKQAVHELLSPT